MRFLTKQLFAFTIVATSFASAVTAQISNDDLSRNPAVQQEQVKQVIIAEFADKPKAMQQKMIQIARCESGLIHIQPDGRLTANPTSTARGALQVLQKTHGEEAARVGLGHLDLTDITDQVKYVKFLVERRQRSGDSPYADFECA